MKITTKQLRKILILSLALIVACAILFTVLTSLGNQQVFDTVLSLGNQQVFDTVYTFQTAILSLGDGQYVKGSVNGWKEYEGSDAIQVKIDGVTYYTHLSNVILIHEE